MFEFEYWKDQIMKRYPDVTRFITASPGELIGEFEDRPGFAVAAIERSAAHFHLAISETYRAVQGTLAVIIAGQVHLIRPGYMPEIHIRRGSDHQALSIDGDLPGPHGALVEVSSSPPWTPEDHHLVP